jgi:hypothetical protein
MARKDWIRTLRRDVVELRVELAPMEKGEVHTGHRPHRGIWEDTTLSDIRDRKKVIGTLETIIGRYESEETAYA